MKQKIADLINVIFGFRKFLILLTLYAIAITFRLKGLLNGDEMVRLIEPTTIAFIGANGIEHVVNAVQTHYTNKNGPATDTVIPPSSVEKEEEESAKNG